MNNDRTHFTLLSSATMISTTTTTIARYLPRTTAAAALKCARPAFTRHINYYSQHISYQRASLSSIPSAGKDGTLSRDALADIIVAEHGLSGAESKRVLTTIFDTIVEVSFYDAALHRILFYQGHGMTRQASHVWFICVCTALSIFPDAGTCMAVNPRLSLATLFMEQWGIPTEVWPVGPCSFYDAVILIAWTEFIRPWHLCGIYSLSHNCLILFIVTQLPR